MSRIIMPGNYDTEGDLYDALYEEADGAPDEEAETAREIVEQEEAEEIAREVAEEEEAEEIARLQAEDEHLQDDEED